MVAQEREDAQDPYEGISNEALLRRLIGVRAYLPDDNPLYVTSVLCALAKMGGFPKLSADYFRLTNGFRAIFEKNRIVPMEKGEDKRRLTVDNTGADLLIALGYIYMNSGHNFRDVVGRALQEVDGNSRLAKPLQRFLER